MRYTGFIGPSYTLDSKDIDAQRTVNLYPKVNETGKGKSLEVAALISTPGLGKINTLGNGPIRGFYTGSNGKTYVVSGDRLYQVNENLSTQEIGKLSSTSGNVDFADNGTTLVIVDGDNGYWHTFSSSIVTKFNGVEWLGSTTVNYVDGYFLFNDPGTGKFYISNLNSVAIDALDFAIAGGAPDNIIATLVNHREVWLFGTDSIEAWFNSGNPDFPFQRIGGGFIEIGLAAAFSVAKINRSVLWIGRNKEGTGIIYRAEGLNAQRVSTHAVEFAIQSYGDLSDAVAWTYQENGHDFYVLNFTSANTTWVYDLTTGLWHERAYLKNGKLERHRANCHALGYGFHLVGDYENGNIYKLDSSIYSDDGAPIKRIRTAPHVSQQQKRISYKSLEVEVNTGAGAVSGRGEDPTVVLEYSDDGGHSWSNEKYAKLGKIGVRGRVIWRRLGASRDRVFRVSTTDPIKFNLIGAEFDAELMGH